MNHATLVHNLSKPGEDIIASMTPNKAHVLHMAIGIAGEAGELLEAIKKYVMYEKEIDGANIIEELGDLEYYMEGLRQGLCIRRDETIENNISKLSKRYASGSFSNQQAQDRADKE